MKPYSNKKGGARMYKVIYQKENGNVIERIRNTYPNYSIGETTSMGWVVLDILHNYKGEYYSSSDYYQLISKNKNKRRMKKQLIEGIKKYRWVVEFLIVFSLIYIM